MSIQNYACDVRRMQLLTIEIILKIRIFFLLYANTSKHNFIFDIKKTDELTVVARIYHGICYGISIAII